tara:strand:+ start:459 stop:755 length:297 start_codon:yes stop_codon:yes gene_type:complete
MKIGKYEFNSAEQGEAAISKFKNSDHTFARLGNITPTKWHVDVCWCDGVELHPRGWKSYSIELEHEGVHRFKGINYLDNKFDSRVAEVESEDIKDADS